MLSFFTSALLAASYVSAVPISARQDTCDATACGVALGPTGVTCVSAAVKRGADPFSDASCIAGVVNLGVNTPAACSACIDVAKDKVPEFFENVADNVQEQVSDFGDDVTQVFDSFKDGLSNLFGRQEQCDLAQCGVALGPTGVTCVSAIATLGASLISNASCAASVLNLGLNIPSTCRPCVDDLKEKVPEPLQPTLEIVSDVKADVNEVIDNVTDEATNFFTGLFGREVGDGLRFL